MWLDELTDEFAVLGEHYDEPEAIGWERAMRAELGRAGAIEAVLASPMPPAVRRLALEDLAR